MRYRRYNVSSKKKGQYDVTSYGIVARGFYLMIFVVLLINFATVVWHYWYA